MAHWQANCFASLSKRYLLPRHGAGRDAAHNEGLFLPPVPLDGSHEFHDIFFNSEFRFVSMFRGLRLLGRF
jgi:hypothetical protein